MKWRVSLLVHTDAATSPEVVPGSPRCLYNSGFARRDRALRLPMYFLYRVLTAAGIPVLAFYYLLRGWRRGESVATLRERFRSVPAEVAARATKSPGAVWIHAVSVGEVLAAKPLVEALKQRDPARTILLSTTTTTGQRLAHERLATADGIFYFPLDRPASVRRALEAIRPALVLVMETEIWPNFLREARRRSIPVVFVNARISERSFARFERWKFLVEGFFRSVLNDGELFLTQAEEDARRLVEMGAPEERIQITGNLKYDGEPPKQSPFGAWLEEQLRQQDRWPVVVAGSVVAEEEEPVLAGFDYVQRQWRRALLVLAPRKPDRFDRASEIIAARGWKVLRRSQLDLAPPLAEDCDVFLLDSIGELAGLYALADAVFVGGSLVLAGGHNILEPAWFGQPPVFGPSMENFRDIAEKFLDAGAGLRVFSGDQLGKAWVRLIRDPALREHMGQAARDISEKNRGATRRTLEQLLPLLDAKGNAR